MDNIVFIVLRRMRAPLLWLVGVYALALLGLVLIPGQDAQGRPWHMDFFHAFYFVSFMSTTIGFGEVPYEFTDGQRLWVTLCIYATVVVWIYAIGTLLTLIQDRGFQQAITERRFARRIARLRDRFYLVCGYGETGGALVRALTERGQHAVALDIREERISALRLEPLREYVPGLCGDASRPRHLLAAGLGHPRCAGVVALTNDNQANLRIALATRLLHPDIQLICRADSRAVEANMASFGTPHIYDPFETFAAHLATALESPCLYLLNQWLSGEESDPLAEPRFPPHGRHWVVCGYGRFGKALVRRLTEAGLAVVVVEADPERTGRPTGEWVRGVGVDAGTLGRAGIERAAGLVAGTDDDADNLSIVMTARELNPDLFVVARANLEENQTLFAALSPQMVMHPASIVANRIRVLMATPLLSEFERLMMFQEETLACQLVSRLAALSSERVPVVWETPIDDEAAHALSVGLGESRPVRLADLLRDPRGREQALACIPLLLVRGRDRMLLPGEETRLHPGERLLFCGRPGVRGRMEWTLQNLHALNYVLTGESRPQGWVWRHLIKGR